MWDVKACTVCFNTDCKLYKIDSGQLKRDFCLISGIQDSEMAGMPQHLCVECSAYVKRFRKFRDKCKRAHFTLKELLKSNNQVTKLNLQAINRERLDIMPSLSYLQLNKVRYDTAKFKWEKQNRLNVIIDDTIPVFHYGTMNIENENEVPKKKPRLSNAAVKEETDDVDYDEQSDDGQDSTSKVVTDEFIFDNNEVGIENDDETAVANDNDNDGEDYVSCKEESKEEEADGTYLQEEYASLVPITMKEAKAVVEVCKIFGAGKSHCKICNKAFSNDTLCKSHSRMHDPHISGTFLCEVCQLYYKTDFLLKTHMTEKHMYKYVCKKCPEVSFDRKSAKQHYIWRHLQKRDKIGASWYKNRPTWLRQKNGNQIKSSVPERTEKKVYKLPDDFPAYSPVTQEEQYQIVEERKKSRNYLEALYKCEFCYRGFREANTYGKHMRKHDPAFSGKFQCDMCKIYFRDARKIYKHMNITHLFKYSCQVCNYSCYNRSQAHIHYRWHKNVTYSCPHCKKEFKKASTRLTHVRVKHPSTNICNMCGHSFVSESGLYCHKRLAHSMQEIEASESSAVDPTDPYYCAECDVQFLSDGAYKTHLGSSNKHVITNVSSKPKRFKVGERKRRGRPRKESSDIVNNGVPTSTHCEVCNTFLANDVQARKHYESEHPGAEYLKRYMCDVCGHTTRQYANLTVHMRTHTQEKPYDCPHCDRRFSMPSNRDRHLVVHTGEKRYQCQHCDRRFTQSSAVKLHIQTVHLKIPYAPWDKKNRKRRKELESAAVSVSAAPPCLPPPPKVMLDSHADYLNAYITYNDE